MKKIHPRDIYRKQCEEAMPDVRRLVEKHGRKQIAYCLSKIRLRDREKRKLDALKKQVAEMEAGLR